MTKPVSTLPFLKWAGSKRRLLPKLTPYWSKGYARYIEPFAGSAALFYAVQPRRALLGDINKELVQTFLALKDHPRGVYNRLTGLLPGKETFLALRELDPTTLRIEDRAARFIFLNRFCFNGLYRTDKWGRFNVPYSESRTGRIPDWSQFAASARCLKVAEIRHGDFESLVTEHVRKDDFVYLDPPYAVENRRVFRQYDSQTFGIDDLERLGALLHEIDRRGARFVVSYAYCAEAKRLFARWNCRKVFCQRNISGFAKHRRVAAELIASN